MPGSWSSVEHPGLVEFRTYEKTSESTRQYNCIAWAAGEKHRLWWPDQAGIGYWPASVPRVVTLEAFLQAYGTLGYEECGMNGSLEPDYQKIAIFAKHDAWGIEPTHAALQLPNGHWSSKLGPLEDIKHYTANAVSGPSYGQVVCYMKRPI